MATPEQNTLLALQLFGAPVQQFNQQNDKRTALFLQLAQQKHAEELANQRTLQTQGFQRELETGRDARARELAGEQNQRYIDLEKLRATNSQNLADKTADRQDTNLRALQVRDDEKSKQSDLKEIRKTLAAAYPKYAAEAERLGEEVRDLKDFDESWQGVGDLQAELARIEQTRIKRDQRSAAVAAVGELDDATAAVSAQQKILSAAMEPHPEDIKFARGHAIEAVRQAIESGAVTGAPKASSPAATKGLAALSRGDTTEASSLLGSEVLSAYDNAYQAALQAAPNYKGRMQEATIAQQNYQLAQRNLSQIQSDLRKAAAGNISLSTELTGRRSALQDLMTPGTAASPSQPRSFDQITPPRGGATAAPKLSASSPAGAPPVQSTMAPASSVLGLIQRAPSAGELAMAPANILAFPGRALDVAGQYGTAALNGLYNGNFNVPEKGSFQRIGEGIGSLLSGGDPFNPANFDELAPPPTINSPGYKIPVGANDRRVALERLRLALQALQSPQMAGMPDDTDPGP